MKTVFFLTALLFSLSVQAQSEKDRQAIKSMCGCFEVKFNFAETFSYPRDTTPYEASKNSHQKALEWVELVEETPNKISLQHLLLVSSGAIVKHWRQDWRYENTEFYDYNGFNDWNYLTKSPEQVKGQWTQWVFEVDDIPRYSGSATWVHVDGRHYWANTSHAPLPRREYTKRQDYNITRRTNVHEITPFGWIHNQDNDKIIRDSNGEEYLLASEKGYNTYTKVEDSRCLKAQVWWQENQDFWAKVRNRWEQEFAKKQYLHLAKGVEGKPLFLHLRELDNTATQEEINFVIDKFVISQ
jgi:hypothetical protein